MIYPKDNSAGGTWVTVCENGNAGVLFNGAFQKHQQKQKYKKSRGLVLLDIMASDNPVQNFKKSNFYEIEPFTIIIRQNHRLYEFRWDEQTEHIKLLDADHPYIWSSCTLYDAEMQRQQNESFYYWLKHNGSLDSNEIMRYHRTSCYKTEPESEEQNSLQVKTVSITHVKLQRQDAYITYYDTLQNKAHVSCLQITDAVTAQ
jgi:hypothetical protein